MMEKIANIVTQHQIQFVWPHAPLYSIQRIELKRTVNEHAHLKITGILNEHQAQDCLARTSCQDTLELYQTDGQILFKGRLDKIKIDKSQEVYYITIEGISATAMLDIRQRNRSFQNINQTYTELTQEVIKHYKHSDFIDTISKESKIGEPRIQYSETDWQFLKRMVSYLGGVLVADITDNRPRFWFGLPQGVKELNLNEGNYVLRKNLHTYRDSVDNYQADIAEADLVECEIESHKYLDIGDKVKFQGRTMFVWSSVAVLEKGTLLYQYKLMGANGIRQNPIPNTNIKGAGIEGSIIDVAENMVKVYLAFDIAYHAAGDYWFPYSVDGNNAIYSMPQKGSWVVLYFPTTREKDAFVTYSKQSLPPNDIQDIKYRLTDTGNKYFSTIYGKEMHLRKDRIMFYSLKTGFAHSKEQRKFVKEVLMRGSQHYNITMDTKQGFYCHSDLDINIQAEGKIKIDTCKELNIYANNSILLTCRGDSISFDDNRLNFVSGLVKYNK